uniref:Uncharacterized protein n=1 Tax=Ceratitis capitata TaxID=7213 RepID=W8C785_CERCA
MRIYGSDLSETTVSSSKTSTDTASNWSRPVKKKPKKTTVEFIPRRTTRLLTSQMCSRLSENHYLPKAPHIKLQRYRLKMRRPLSLKAKQTKAIIQTINDQSLIVCYLWPRCQQKTEQLENEVARLQQRLHELQVEEVEIKRKRWCRVCEKEATYVHSKRFYCSLKCQRKQK